jgi:hypothetical protein
VNLFAWRATNPRELKPLGTTERIGALNDWYLSCTEGDVVAAWGAGFPYQHEFGRQRIYQVEKLLNRSLMCVKKTEQRPWHPLYVPYGAFLSLKETNA